MGTPRIDDRDWWREMLALSYRPAWAGLPENMVSAAPGIDPSRWEQV
jgi:hypothetical protein